MIIEWMEMEMRVIWGDESVVWEMWIWMDRVFVWVRMLMWNLDRVDEMRVKMNRGWYKESIDVD